MALTISDVAALWGAMLSTVIAGIAIYRHFTAGPKLRLSIAGPLENGKLLDEFPRELTIGIENYGTSPTIIEAIRIKAVERTWGGGKVINQAMFDGNTPHKVRRTLLPGDIASEKFQFFSGWDKQRAARELIEVSIYHHRSKRPVTKRIRDRPRRV